MLQVKLFRSTRQERRREILCFTCLGDWRLCKFATCPKLKRLRALFTSETNIGSTSIHGSAPPAVFVGSWGYPKILAGPLVPPVFKDTTIMDAPELWLDKSMDDLLMYRFSLVRGKARFEVKDARNPGRMLSTIQESVMAAKPLDTEVKLLKRPFLQAYFSARSAPIGPSAPMERVILTQNPSIPNIVDKVVCDVDLKAEEGTRILSASGVKQRQITRLFSIGLLGVKKERRLVPTEWSITAVDDILARALRSEVLDYSEISEFRLFGHKALSNNVQILLLPSPWMFEALEAWLTSPNPMPSSDYEMARGRKSYPANLEGAYHASRLPVLEYLHRVRRQAGAIVFLEVHRGWIPLGVWRFREIAREALKKSPTAFSSLEDALNKLGERLSLDVKVWTKKSTLIRLYSTQRRIEHFI